MTNQGSSMHHPSSGPISANDDVAREVRVEQMRLSFAHSADLLLLASGFALVLGAYLATYYPPVEVLLWLGIKIGIVVPRLKLAHRSQQHDEKRPSRLLMLGLLALDGFWWGIVGVWVARGPTEPLMVVSAYLASNASVAIFNLQIRYAATAFYLIPLIVPSSLALFLRLDPLGICLSLGLLFLVGLMLLTAQHSASRLAEVFRLRIFADQVSRERGQALHLAHVELERIEAEEALREERARIDALREATQARSVFLSKVSHELRSPLQSIVSALDVFEMRLGRSGAAGEDELIKRMRRASMLLNTQLRDLLTLARGQAGRLELHLVPFEVGALVEGVVCAARDAVPNKSLEIRLDLPPEPLSAISDAARIDQVLTNLVVNSARHTDSGEVRVTLHPYHVSGKCLRFTVADTGPGIPPAVLPALFDPDKLFTTGEARGDGSGIGLAVVRTLVDHLGGTISVASRLPVGTSIDVEIPAELIHVDAVG